MIKTPPIILSEERNGFRAEDNDDGPPIRRDLEGGKGWEEDDDDSNAVEADAIGLFGGTLVLLSNVELISLLKVY